MIPDIWDLVQFGQIHRLQGQVSTLQSGRTQDGVARDAAFRVERKLDQIALVCQAMFELLSETSGVTEDQLKRKIVDIDGRDGDLDGRMAPRAKKCPKCEATMSPQFGRCLFCGHQDGAAPVTSEGPQQP